MARDAAGWLFLLPLFGLAACAPAEGEMPPPLSRMAPAQVVVMESPLALFPASSGGWQARLSGRLSLQDNCVYVVNERGQRWLPLFRSPGTDWNAASQTLSIGSRSFRSGDDIQLSGGSLGAVTDTSRWINRPPGCDLSSVWLVTMDLQ